MSNTPVEMVLARLPETLKDTLINIGFLDFLPHQDTIEGALAALTPGGEAGHGK